MKYGILSKHQQERQRAETDLPGRKTPAWSDTKFSKVHSILLKEAVGENKGKFVKRE